MVSYRIVCQFCPLGHPRLRLGTTLRHLFFEVVDVPKEVPGPRIAKDTVSRRGTQRNSQAASNKRCNSHATPGHTLGKNWQQV